MALKLQITSINKGSESHMPVVQEKKIYLIVFFRMATMSQTHAQFAHQVRVVFVLCKDQSKRTCKWSNQKYMQMMKADPTLSQSCWLMFELFNPDARQ